MMKKMAIWEGEGGTKKGRTKKKKKRERIANYN